MILALLSNIKRKKKKTENTMKHNEKVRMLLLYKDIVIIVKIASFLDRYL